MADEVQRLFCCAHGHKNFPLWYAKLHQYQHGNGYVRHLKKVPKGPKNQVRMKIMAATTTSGFTFTDSAPPVSTIRASSHRRRRISPQAGRALEILGHAIEYLTDEFIHAGRSFSASDGQLEAVQLLMAVNREIYFECPEVLSFGERFLSLLHLRAA
jgi:hypothetical protein